MRASCFLECDIISITSISIQEQNFRFFHRTYFTPIHLQKMFPTAQTSVIIVKHTKAHLSTCFGHVIAAILERGSFCEPGGYWQTSSYQLNHTLENIFDADAESPLIIL